MGAIIARPLVRTVLALVASSVVRVHSACRLRVRFVPNPFPYLHQTLDLDCTIAGGGYPICGLYDVNQAKFGLSDHYVTASSNFGKHTEVFDGVDVTINAQPGARLTLGGGFSSGRTRTNRCFVVDSPQEMYQCDVRPPFQTQVKFLGSYNLPWDSQISATTVSVRDSWRSRRCCR